MSRTLHWKWICIVDSGLSVEEEMQLTEAQKSTGTVTELSLIICPVFEHWMEEWRESDEIRMFKGSCWNNLVHRRNKTS